MDLHPTLSNISKLILRQFILIITMIKLIIKYYIYIDPHPTLNNISKLVLRQSISLLELDD